MEHKKGWAMGVVSFSHARKILTDLVNHVAYAGKRVVLTRKGKKVAAIVSMDDLELLESLKTEAKDKASI